MDPDIQSGSSSVGDDWERDGDVSIQSMTNCSDVKDVSSPSLESDTGASSEKKLLWPRLLGVANRPNPLEDWDQLYNLNNQTGLRNDCRQLAKAIDNKKSVPELESFMTLYCKKRNVDYNKNAGWIQVMEKILKYEIPSEHLFNVFYAFTTKYVPKETKEGSQIYDLFRLILQYHDPEISSHLDSLKCTPYLYACDWFCTIFASCTNEDTCRSLWEAYIDKGDPFLMFYMALVLIENAKEQLMQINYSNRDDAIRILTDLPSMLGVDDVIDFVQLAAYYSTRTPQSIREDFHYKIFGANYDDEASDLNVSRLLCLPVTVQEVTRRDPGIPTNSTIGYFVVDCRSQDAYSCGHIYASFNLDCQLIVDNPEQFEMGISSLEAYKNDQKFEEHYCFVGYGTDEQDQFMHMVIARFLRDGKTHVSIAQGGYKHLHRILIETNRLRILSSHVESKCSECLSGQPKSWNLVGKMKEAVISKSVSVKEKVNTLVLSPPPTAQSHHVAPSERHGKRYRNERSVFSLEDGSSDEEGPAIFTAVEKKKEEICLAEHAEFIETFPCHELTSDKGMHLAHIALTRTHIHVLRDIPKKTGFVTTEARHALSTVIRVTSKKKVPELLTFKFGYEIGSETKITAVHRFLVPKAGECAKAVKTAIFALRPLSDNAD